MKLMSHITKCSLLIYFIESNDNSIANCAAILIVYSVSELKLIPSVPLSHIHSHTLHSIETFSHILTLRSNNKSSDFQCTNVNRFDRRLPSFFFSSIYTVSMLQSKVHSHFATWKYAYTKRKLAIMLSLRVWERVHGTERKKENTIRNREIKSKQTNNMETISCAPQKLPQ